MKLGNLNIVIFFFALFSANILPILAADKIESVPLINLEELSPTFEEGKDELDKIDDKNTTSNNRENVMDTFIATQSDEVYVNLKALDKITAKTSAFKLALGEKKFFGPLEIVVQKCQLSENDDFSDSVAYLQVKDLSSKDNNQVFLFNGWTFTSSPTLQSIDHPVYDLWITSCENI